MTAQDKAREIIARANERLCTWSGYVQRFGKTEMDAPIAHALVQAVADELLALEERVARLERAL